MQKLEKNIPFLFFLLTLFFAPLAFGTVETWSIATVELLVGSTALLYFFRIRKEKAALFKTPGLLPLALLIGWICFQLIPLPPALVRILAPATFQVYAPILSIGDSGHWIPLTVMQKATSLELLRVSCYGLFYILTVQLLSHGGRLQKTVRWVVWLAIAIAFLAIVQKFTSPDKIYWFRPTPPNAGTVGPWVYHNHYAGFMEMLCPLALALFFYYRPTVNYSETLRARVAALFTDASSNRHFFLGFGVVLIMSSVLVSLSRGGVISMSLSLLLFLFLLSRKKTKTGLLFVLLFCCILLALSWFGWQPLLSKFSRAITETGGIKDARFMIWKDAGGIIRDFLFTGSGFGTFVDIYPQYRTIPGNLVAVHAHNDYIELLTDGGLIGFILAGWFVLAVIAEGWKKITIRRDRYAILVGIGALTGIVSILLHSVTDFNMHNGANGLYFFFLCGVLVSAGNTRLHFRTRPTLLKPAGRRRKYLFPVAGLLLFFMVLLVHGGGFLAASSYSNVSSIYLNQHLADAKLQQVRRALVRSKTYDPLEGFYPATLGTVELYLQHRDKALLQYAKAARLDPMNGVYLQNLGLFTADRSPEQSKALLAAAYERALHKERLILTWAGWLLQAGERQEAVEVLKNGLQRYHRLLVSYLPILVAYSFSREEIANILPESTSSWIRLGKFMEKRGKLIESEYYRSHALKYLDQEKIIRPWYFGQLYSFYRRQKQDDKALAVLRQAIERLPDYAPFHVYLGNYYKKEGIDYRAREEYEQALLLEPGNEKIRKKLKQLKGGGRNSL
ncbi:MAG TPA: lipid A core--O-antigen ligase [Desulfobulbus sp.]|nr:lipid A core--O-antigen ligase [Desulfobulbus sp.]